MSENAPIDPVQSEAYERRHVHDVYEQIAPHFSSTRYKVCACVLPHSGLNGVADPPPTAVAHCRCFP
jgi:hypothetical protein